MLTLYKNIKRFREEKRMSQDTLAKLTGYSDRSSITKIEKGLVDLQQSKIELFAKALGTTAKDLVGWNDEEVASNPPIMDYYNSLNPIGQKEAEKRVEELTHFPKYTLKALKEESPYLSLGAAHNEGKQTQEELDLMREDAERLKNL